MTYGATPADWAHWQTLGLESDLLPMFVRGCDRFLPGWHGLPEQHLREVVRGWVRELLSFRQATHHSYRIH